MKIGSIKMSEQRELTLYIALATVLALMARFVLMPYVSEDVNVFIVWFMKIRNEGGVAALTESSSLFLYNPPFMYLLIIANLLPAWVPEIVAIKSISIPFELLTALLSAKILKKVGCNNKIAALGYATLLFLPTVLLNGAVWGQSDAIYTSFIVLSLYFLIKENSSWAMIAFGAAISFKLQAMVFAPAILCFWLVGKIKSKDVFFIPLVYLLLLVPSALAGREVSSLLGIYANQADTYRHITANAPNLYVWFSDGDFYKWLPDSLFFILKPLAYILTLAFVLLFSSSVRFSKAHFGTPQILLISFVSVLFSPYLLPMMHERYFYVADILSVLFAFCIPKLFYIPILLQVASGSCYLNFLIGRYSLGKEELALRTEISSLIITFVLIVVTREFYLRLYKAQSRTETDIQEESGEANYFNSQKIRVALGGSFVLFLLMVIVMYHPRYISTTLYLPVTTKAISNSDGLAQVNYSKYLRATRYTKNWKAPIYDADLRGYPLVIEGKQSRKSLCVHAKSEILFNLSGAYSRLTGRVGFADYLDRKTAETSVVHEILGDGKILWTSGVLKVTSPSAEYNIDVSKVNNLDLRVSDAGDGIGYDHSCWTNISLQP